MLLPVSAPAVQLALMEWEEGVRRLEQLEVPSRRMAVYRRVVDEIVAELARRMGQTFTLAQLAEEYAESAPWCKHVAQRSTDEVWAHDLSIVGDAAFARFARNATDYRP